MSVPRATQRNTQMGYALDDRRYGGAPANGSDDSATFAGVWAHCVADQVPLVIPAGTAWHLNSTLDPGAWQFPAVVGAAYESSKVILGSGVTMMTPTLHQNGCIFRDFTCQAGKGLYHSTYTGPQVAQKFKFHNMRFYDYTGCVIANEAPDSPYLEVEGCEFRGHDFLQTMGIAWSGDGDNFRIAGNIFCVNRIGVKLAHRPDDAGMRGPKNGLIENNDFLRLARGATDPSTHNIWVVPGTTTTGGTTGAIALYGNRFGSESLRDETTNGINGIANSDGQADRWILFADEDAIGSDNTTRFPVFTASTGGVNGFSVDETNMFNGVGSPTVPFPRAIAYSTTPYVIGCKFAGYLRGQAPLYALELRDDPSPLTGATQAAADIFNQGNIFGPFRAPHAGVDQQGVRPSNYYGLGRMLDPIGQFSGRQLAITAEPGGQNPSGYVDLLTTRSTSYTISGGSSKTSVTDSQGAADAIEITYASNGTARATLGSFTPGKPVFVDFDVQTGQTGTPLSTLDLQILIPAGNSMFRRGFIDLPAAWEARRFWFVPRDAGPYSIQFLSSAAGTARIGRVQVYHAREPLSHGPYLFRSPNGTIYRAGVDNTGGVTGVALATPYALPMASAKWYSPEGVTTATLLLTANKLYAVPFDFTTAIATTNLGLEITVAGSAGSVIRLGIYGDTGGAPGSLILDAGTIDGTVLYATTPGAVAGAHSMSIGRCYLVAAGQGSPTTQPTVRVVNSGIGGVQSNTANQPGAGSLSGYVENGVATSGALPGTFPAFSNSGSVPRVVVKT